MVDIVPSLPLIGLGLGDPVRDGTAISTSMIFGS
jgi:hypothetical protein